MSRNRIYPPLVLVHVNTYSVKDKIKALGGKGYYEEGSFVGWKMPTQKAYDEAYQLCENVSPDLDKRSAYYAQFDTDWDFDDVVEVPAPTPKTPTTLWGGTLKSVSREQIEALLPCYGYDISRIWQDEMGEMIIALAREGIGLDETHATIEFHNKMYPSTERIYAFFGNNDRKQGLIFEAAAALAHSQEWLSSTDFTSLLCMNARKLGTTEAKLQQRARAVVDAFMS